MVTNNSMKNVLRSLTLEDVTHHADGKLGSLSKPRNTASVLLAYNKTWSYKSGTVSMCGSSVQGQTRTLRQLASFVFHGPYISPAS